MLHLWVGRRLEADGPLYGQVVEKLAGSRSGVHGDDAEYNRSIVLILAGFKTTELHLVNLPNR